MSEVYEKLLKCCKSVREKTDFVPEAALILGSGLGDYADDLKIEASVNYADIEGFPVSTVKGHKGRFVFAHVEGVPVVIMQGRVHYMRDIRCRMWCFRHALWDFSEQKRSF